MRISDWSSDVCSSDLSRRRLRARKCRLHSVSNGRSFRSRNFGRGTMAYLQQRPTAAFRVVAILLTLWNAFGCYAWYLQWTLGADAMGPATQYDRQLYAALTGWYHGDRTSVVEGQSVSVRVDLGG